MHDALNTHTRSAHWVWQRHSRELIASVVCLISIYSFPYLALASYNRSSILLIHSLSLALSFYFPAINWCRYSLVSCMCKQRFEVFEHQTLHISTRMDDLLACFILWCAPFNVLLLAFFHTIYCIVAADTVVVVVAIVNVATLAFHIMVYAALSLYLLSTLLVDRSFCLFTFVFVYQSEYNTSLCSL